MSGVIGGGGGDDDSGDGGGFMSTVPDKSIFGDCVGAGGGGRTAVYGDGGVTEVEAGDGERDDI